jgi:superfamily I DNA/RNA helicase
MFRIFGPPGTGKTTTLLNMVDKALANGTPPQTIGFLAFTRKAANEAKERAAERFRLDPKKDLQYFRTLHSFALTLSGIRPEQIMQPEHYAELSQAMGIHLVTGRNNPIEDDMPDLVKASDPILSLINLARLRKVPLRKQYNVSSVQFDWNTVNHVDRCLRAYKHESALFDFTDMLQTFIDKGHEFCPRFNLCFLDEAQDLSPMQWDIAHLIEDKTQQMYCAGDDDQAIYKWAGADVEHFLGLDGGSETLQQSYRIPAAVHAVAETIAKRIHNRYPKIYKPKQERGCCARIAHVAELDMSEGSWLILAQAGYQLQPVAADLRSFGHLYEYRGSRSINQKLSDAVNGWTDLQKAREVSIDTVRNIYSYMSTGKRIARGYKKLTGIPDDELVNIDDLQLRHGLIATKDMIWSEAMDRIAAKDRAYITALLRRGEKFNGTPRISVSTIHGSKGGEADNVVLFTDLSPAADSTMRIAPDDIHRVFYVGVTRTRKNLYLVEPEDATRSYDV